MKSVKLDINEVISKVAQLNITKKGVKNFLQKYESEYVGLESIEFYGFRNYTSEDNPRTIDWRSSIRSGDLLCRETLIEKEPEVILAIDCGASTLYGSVDKLKIEHEIELALAIAHICLTVGFTVGAVLYNDKVQGFARPTSGRIQLHHISQVLLNPTVFGSKGDLRSAFGLINALVKRESVVIFISDFIGFDEDQKNILNLLALKCRVIGIMVRDRLDKTLPSGGHVLFRDPSGTESLLVNTNRIASEYEAISREQENSVVKRFVNTRSKIIRLYTNESFEDNFHKLVLQNASV
mgnify:CR=1 FL=1